MDKARHLLFRAYSEVPIKSKSSVLLECSKLEEFVGNIDIARNILYKAEQEMKSEWKICLESVLLEARNGNIRQAIRSADNALKVHAGTGRLWATYIQLCHRCESQLFKGSLDTR